MSETTQQAREADVQGKSWMIPLSFRSKSCLVSETSTVFQSSPGDKVRLYLIHIVRLPTGNTADTIPFHHTPVDDFNQAYHAPTATFRVVAYITANRHIMPPQQHIVLWYVSMEPGI